MRLTIMVFALVMVVNGVTTTAHAETPDEWITLGARVHGGFGAFIPVGIRIGLDALERLNAKPREVTVLYYDSDKAPCVAVRRALSPTFPAGEATGSTAPTALIESRVDWGLLSVVTLQKRTFARAVGMPSCIIITPRV